MRDRVDEDFLAKSTANFNLTGLKKCKDAGLSLVATDARGRTLLWKIVRGFTSKRSITDFEGAFSVER